MNDKIFDGAALKVEVKKLNPRKVFEEKAIGSRAIWQTTIDLIFACAPIFLLAFISTLNGRLSGLSLFGLSDWSLIATFLFGQAIIKAFQFPYDTFILQGSEVATGIVALLICIGLLPAAMLYALTFAATEKSFILILFQMIWFILSVILYGLIAFVSNAATIFRFELSKIVSQKANLILNGDEDVLN